VVTGILLIGCLLWLAIDPLQQLRIPSKGEENSVAPASMQQE